MSEHTIDWNERRRKKCAYDRRNKKLKQKQSKTNDKIWKKKTSAIIHIKRFNSQRTLIKTNKPSIEMREKEMKMKIQDSDWIEHYLWYKSILID